MPVEEPEKELRFTRSAQALPWFILSALCIPMVTMGIIFLSYPETFFSVGYRPYWWILLILAILCAVSCRIAIRCIKHAYIILTPLGIEIFPFLKPQKNLRMIYWSEIDSAEINEKELRLHFNPEFSAGVVASLKPITKDKQEWLAKAIIDQLNRLEES